ncbi:MAG: uridine phosphorylase [Chloroflexota bacterium]
MPDNPLAEDGAARADRPIVEGGKQYHVRLAPGDLSQCVLLPGDPFRVPVLAKAWDTAHSVAQNREYNSMRGKYRGADISACSTGIGGPSTEIAINELAEIGCTTFLRLGTTGGLQSHIRVGHVIISTASVRWDGASDSYAPSAYPAASSFEVTIALIEACERLNVHYHLGVSASTSSFYSGQSRPAFGGYTGAVPDRAHELQTMGVLNFEMEAATVFTLCSLLGLRGGAACVVVADRFRNEFRHEGADDLLAQIGGEAVLALTKHDDVKQRAGKTWFFPSLLQNEPA